jgi:hypothetical protein
MKKIHFILLVVFILFSQFKVSSQIDSTRKVFVGFTAGMSFFGPSGVNNKLKELIGDVDIQSGFSEIVMNVNGSFSIIYKINERVDFSGIFDIAIAPKVLTIYNTGETSTFSFNRFSPGAMCNIYFGNEKNSKFVMGAGVLYNFMNFEGYTGSGFSLRLQAGQNFKMGSVIVKCLGVINLMPPVNGNNQGDIIQLNYTDIGACLGIEF